MVHWWRGKGHRRLPRPVVDDTVGKGSARRQVPPAELAHLKYLLDTIPALNKE